MKRHLGACGVLAVGIGLAAAANGQSREAPGAAAQVRAFEPVTDAVLANPDPSDWLHWRRTLDGWGFWHDRLVTY